MAMTALQTVPSHCYAEGMVDQLAVTKKDSDEESIPGLFAGGSLFLMPDEDLGERSTFVPVLVK